LSSGSKNHSVQLRVAAVSGIAGRIEETAAVAVVKDDGASVVSAVGVRFGELKASSSVDLRYGTIDVLADRIRGINGSWSVGIRYIELVDRSYITTKRKVLAVGGEMKSQF
jgi:hypothetical protein